MTAALLGVALVSIALVRGDSSGNRPTRSTTGTNVPAARIGDELSAGSFTRTPLLTYDMADGGVAFALQIQPKLDPQPERPRDIAIMVDTSASQAGKALTRARELADRFLRDAGKADRVSLWTVNIPKDKSTRSLTGGFRQVRADGAIPGLEPKVATAVKSLSEEYASGAVDLGSALRRAAKEFEGKSSRQQVIVYLGDGESAYAPMVEKDRFELARELRSRNVAFFAVPLGGTIHSANIHTLATATGGAVVRFSAEDEASAGAVGAVSDRLTRAIAVPVLQPESFKLDAEVVEMYPAKLPPLRADAPTLVMGKLKARSAAKLEGVVVGRSVGKEVSVAVSQTMVASAGENSFIVPMLSQWKNAPVADAPAMLRADRTLALAFEQTRLAVDECLTQANWAINANQFDAAKGLFQTAASISPDSTEARSGVVMTDKLKSGLLTRADLIKQAMTAQGGVRIDQTDKGQFRVSAVQLQVPPEPIAPPASVELSDLAKAEEARRAIADRQAEGIVEDSLRAARARLTAGDPEGAKDLLTRQRESIRANIDLSESVRRKFDAQLGALSRVVSEQGNRIREQIDKDREALARAQSRLFASTARADIEEQTRARVESFRNLMEQARHEDAYREALILQQERVTAGLPVPIEATAVYQMGQVASNLRESRELVRLREDRFLLTMLSVEKSHVPYPDEPPVHFPPARVWKDLTDIRLKYASGDFEGDTSREARRSSRFIKDLIQKPVRLTLTQPETDLSLDDAFKTLLEFANPILDGDRNAIRVPVIINTAAISAAQGEMFDLTTVRIKIKKDWNGLSLQTILKLMTDQIPKGGTYMLRPDHIEITSADAALRDKVVRAFPVEDLVIPLPNSVAQSTLDQSLSVLGGTFSLGGGGTAFGFAGAFGGNGLGQNQNINQNMGGAGGNPAGNIFNGGMGGNNLGAGGGLTGFGGGNQGQFGNLGGQFGFQGGDQSNLLVQLITEVVARGEWARTPQVLGGANNNADPGLEPIPGDAPASPVEYLNSLGYYPPARALVVRGTSRFHKTYSSKLNVKPGGPMIMAAPNALNKDGRAVAAGEKMKPIDIAKLPEKDLNPRKIWQNVMDKNFPADPGAVIACADFLVQTKEFKHAAELLKASLRQGVTADSWVHEALTIALEASQGDSEELERARVSGIDLEPKKADAYLRASKALNDAGQKERAVSFCRLAAKLEPSLPDPYVNAMVYAGDMKTIDSDASVWAASNLLRRDWPTDTKEYHVQARKHLEGIMNRLRTENRNLEAGKVETVSEAHKKRDLTVQLLWSGSADLDLKVSEPTGSTCSILNRQTTGGGILQADLPGGRDDSFGENYVSAEAFSGQYVVSVDRVWGRPLGNRATIRVIHHQGTADQKTELHTIDLEKASSVTIRVENGRRGELMSMAPPTMAQDGGRKPERNDAVMARLSAMLSPSSASVRSGTTTGGTGTASRTVTQAAYSADTMPSAMDVTFSGRVASVMTGGADMQGSLVFSPKSSIPQIRVTPVFQTAGRKPAGVKLDLIPGSDS